MSTSTVTVSASTYTTDNPTGEQWKWVPNTGDWTSKPYKIVTYPPTPPGVSFEEYAGLLPQKFEPDQCDIVLQWLCLRIFGTYQNLRGEKDA